MKKQFFLFIMMICTLCTCQEIDCDYYKVTPSEEEFLHYTPGDIALFKNDSTGTIDMVRALSLGGETCGCDYPCGKVKGGASLHLRMLHLGTAGFTIRHNRLATIWGIGEYTIRDAERMKAFNGTYFFDVFKFQSDNKYTNGPNAIYFNKKYGFIRFEMQNGGSWTIVQ